jgi:hypothetical protein
MLHLPNTSAAVAFIALLVEALFDMKGLIDVVVWVDVVAAAAPPVVRGPPP